MMIWYNINNKWFDSWTKNFMSFAMELLSPAAKVLTVTERKDYDKIVQKLYKLNNKVYKRINKERKNELRRIRSRKVGTTNSTSNKK